MKYRIKIDDGGIYYPQYRPGFWCGWDHFTRGIYDGLGAKGFETKEEAIKFLENWIESHKNDGKEFFNWCKLIYKRNLL